MTVLVGAICGYAAPTTAAPQTQQPNIVFMLSDDQNWNGTSALMHPDLPTSRSEMFQTPNLEKLASQGMRFTAAYAPSAVCSPTRISLQTGKSPAKMHWTKAAPVMRAADNYKLLPPVSERRISDSEVTIGEMLQRAGYATAHYGKWHLAAGGPDYHGYDDSDGNTGNEAAYQYTDPNPVDIFGMARKAAAFMAKSQRAGKPFFIQLSWHALHAPENALKSTIAKYEKLLGSRGTHRATRAAITEDLDTGVGMVLESIDRLGLAENTYVVYMSDNGGGGGGRRLAQRGPSLRGGKGSLWEGGIRVPLMIRGPGVQPGSWCHTRVVGYDLYPTFCEWAGIRDLPSGIEGGSIAALLKNDGRGTVSRPREELVFHFPHYQSKDGPHSALILGNLKLLKFYEDNRLELYDLANDIGELHNLAETRSDDTAHLHQFLQDYLADVDADLPTINPQYDPSKPSTPQEQGPPEAMQNHQGQRGTAGRPLPGDRRKPLGPNGQQNRPPGPRRRRPL